MKLTHLLPALSWLIPLATADCITSIPEFRIKAVWNASNTNLSPEAQASFTNPLIDMYLAADPTNSKLTWTANQSEFDANRYFFKIDDCGYLSFSRDLAYGGSVAWLPWVDLGAGYVEGTSNVPHTEPTYGTVSGFNYVTPMRPASIKKIRTCVDPVTKAIKLSADYRDKSFNFQGKLLLSSEVNPTGLSYWYTKMYPTVVA